VSIHKATWARPPTAGAHIDEVIVTHGRLDVLVNNAGITTTDVLKLSDELFKGADVNLSGAFFLSQAALRHMGSGGAGAS